jgi:hypothetical protein
MSLGDRYSGDQKHLIKTKAKNLANFHLFLSQILSTKQVAEERFLFLFGQKFQGYLVYLTCKRRS